MDPTPWTPWTRPMDMCVVFFKTYTIFLISILFRGPIVDHDPLGTSWEFAQQEVTRLFRARASKSQVGYSSIERFVSTLYVAI